MDLSTISNEELISSLGMLTGNERECTLKVLYHLIEFDKRGLFREEGYSSLFDYCIRKLGYSEASAHRRIVGARCLRDNPELKELFIQGRVTLCSIARAAKSIQAKVATVQEIIGRSTREVESLVAYAQPRGSKPREFIKPLVVKAKEAPLIPSIPKEERFELRFSVPKEVYTQFEAAKARLSNALQRDLSLEAVFSKLLEHYLKPKVRKGKDCSDTRYVPRSVRRAVYERDSAQCSYVSPNGTRCTEKHYLHFDHVLPYALGGKTEQSNLRLLCSAHNKLMAEQYFGRDYIQQCSRN